MAKPKTSTKTLTPGEQLRAWRKSAQKSQSDIASAVGVATPTVCEWESGHRTPRLEHAVAIERATDGGVLVDAWGFDAGALREFAATRAAREANDSTKGAA
jgi:transcriptional regulator with XRE-family HTH domain